MPGRRFVVHLRPASEGPSLIVGLVSGDDGAALASAYAASIAPMGPEFMSPGHEVLVVEEVSRKPKAV
jgi:hypothetical protein